MNEDDFNSFRSKILKREGPKHHKITGSVGVYDIYKRIRKNNWYNKTRPITEHEFYSIIRTVNKYFAQELVQGNDVILPYKMGRLELVKYDSKPIVNDDKLIIRTPVNWEETLRLWHEDQEAKEQKMLVHYDTNTIFKVKYNAHIGRYTNKRFFTFRINREIKKQLKEQINNKAIDAFIELCNTYH